MAIFLRNKEQIASTDLYARRPVKAFWKFRLAISRFIVSYSLFARPLRIAYRAEGIPTGQLHCRPTKPLSSFSPRRGLGHDRE